MKTSRILTLFLLVIASFTLVTAQTRPDFTIENITVKAGEKATGFIEVPKGIDEGTQIPVSVFHGAKDGKVLLITAGIHGAEHSPILALQRLAKTLDPKKLSGTVILVHIANPPSFFGRTIYYGPDGKNLNRSFPGKENGTITERIAFVITEKLIRRADLYIDSHSGDGNESLNSYVAFYENDTVPQELVETGRRMAHASGFDYIKPIRGRSLNFPEAKYTINTGFILGKPSINLESGELGKPQEIDILRNYEGILNIMRELKMLTDKKPKKFKNLIFITQAKTITSEHKGLFYALVERKQKVKKDQLLGYVTDLFGNRLQEVRAPFSGVVVYFTATPPISKGEALVNLAEISRNK